MPATQDMGYLLGVPETSNAGYLIGVPGTADDVFPFAPKNRLGGLDLNRFQGINSLGVANEEDVEQVDYIGRNPSGFQEGIAKLFEFFQRISPIAAIGRGIESLRNRFDTRKAIQRNIQRDTQGDINIVDLTGGDRGTTTAPQSGMQAERTRTRDLQSMRGGVGR